MTKLYVLSLLLITYMSWPVL